MGERDDRTAAPGSPRRRREVRPGEPSQRGGVEAADGDASNAARGRRRITLQMDGGIAIWRLSKDDGETRGRPAVERCKDVTRPISSADGRAGVSSGAQAMTPMRQRRLRRGNGRIGSDEPAATRRDATRRNSPAVAAAGVRRHGCDAMNDAMARCRPVGCTISTKSRRRDGGDVYFT
ncbi:hypothetical protein Scep_004339 [Stephania cephalantha]|uniref:Uncharacterized protein n=1 Tax=Stephania cephalantha TaxID=152367 RepID=A0AAP0PWK9_9MAGN